MLSFTLNQTKSEELNKINYPSTNHEERDESYKNCSKNNNNLEKKFNHLSTTTYNPEFYSCCCGKIKQQQKESTQFEYEKKMNEKSLKSFIVINILKIALVVILVVLYNQFVIYQIDTVSLLLLDVKKNCNPIDNIILIVLIIMIIVFILF